MLCLSKTKIQKYLDEEFQQNQLIEIKTHLDTCPRCQNQVNIARQKKYLILEKISLLDPLIVPSVDFNDFQIPAVEQTKKWKLPFPNRRIVIPTPVVCILVLVFVAMGIGLVSLKIENHNLNEFKVNMEKVIGVSETGTKENKLLELDLKNFVPAGDSKVILLDEKE